MQENNLIKAWSEVVDFPMQGRIGKPRETGLTMIIDKGMGLASTSELLEIAAAYIDFIKLGFGTSALYNEDVLRKKISLVRSMGVDIYPGGTFFEVACLQNRVAEYLDYAWEIGFSAVEISDGTINMGAEKRQKLIRDAKERGFTVITEFGKKDPDDAPSLQALIFQLEEDLQSEADIVIVEGRESGKGIGIYDKKGEIQKDEFGELLKKACKSPKIMWEAPLKKQQHELIAMYGPNVNLGNIAPGEILALEALRVGMRGDTLKDILAKENELCVLT